eukprot:UN28921
MHQYQEQDENDLQGIQDYIKNPQLSPKSLQNISKGPQRNLDNVISVKFDKLSIHAYQFDPKEKYSSHLVIKLHIFEILDQLEKSNFHKLLYRYDLFSEGEDMFVFEMDIVRPNALSPEREEARISVSILPIRLNVDQHAVDFLMKYFGKKLSDIDGLSDLASEENSPMKKGNQSPTNEDQIEEQDLMKQQDIAPFFIQQFRINPVVLCIDYKPRHVDFSQLSDGDYSQLIHLFPLSKVQIVLQKFTKNGVKGFDKLLTELATYWAMDIGKHQAHRYLSGVQPIRSLVNVGSGVADLVILPYKQFKEDGNLWQGLGKGAFSFIRSVTLEALNVGGGVFSATSKLLNTVDTAVDAVKVPRKRERRRRLVRQRKRKRPVDAYEGIIQACELLSRGLIDAGDR